MDEAASRLRFVVVQCGSLPLRPDRRWAPGVAHRCTATLVWPEGEPVTPDNSVIVDPCFDGPGWAEALTRLGSVGAGPLDIGRYHVSHWHGDHALRAPVDAAGGWRPIPDGGLEGVRLEPCPGHHRSLLALVFAGAAGEVWVVGDAILDEEWLLAWECYWPNGYGPDEIVQTWRSVARIVGSASIVVPGHGPPITVTRSLLGDLLRGLSEQPLAAECPDVAETLQAALARRG